MSGKVSLVAAILFLGGIVAFIRFGWGVGIQPIFLGVWIVCIERAIGFGTFVRFDPSKPASPRARRRRNLLLTLVTVLSIGVIGGIAAVYPDPGALIIGLLALLAIYTGWVISYIKSHDAEGATFDARL